MKEFWINIYGPWHNVCDYYHPTRDQAISATMKTKQVLYRIHVRIK
jgi:hypothetical protein